MLCYVLSLICVHFSVIRNHLDWLTSLPWGKTSEDTIDLGHAKKVLDEDHYDFHNIKDGILVQDYCLTYSVMIKNDFYHIRNLLLSAS